MDPFNGSESHIIRENIIGLFNRQRFAGNLSKNIFHDMLIMFLRVIGHSIVKYRKVFILKDKNMGNSPANLSTNFILYSTFFSVYAFLSFSVLSFC